MTISTVYRPPRGNVDNFINHLKKVYSKKIENWIIGDLNADFMDNSLARTKAIKEFCREKHLRWLFTEITRPNLEGNGGTCIDNMLTNSKYIMESTVSPKLISDHYPIYCVWKKS